MFDIVHVVTTAEEPDLPVIARYKNETLMDPILKEIFNWYFKGWPKSAPAGNNDLIHYYNWKKDITVSNNLVYYNDRIIVPFNLRKETLRLFHETHLGLEKISLKR